MVNLYEYPMEESNERQAEASNSVAEYENEEEKKLKHLEFIQVAAECGVVFLSGLYEFTKQNSFFLKPVFMAVEGILTGIFGPLYDKFQHVPFLMLEFIDRKVDEFIYEVDWQNAPFPTLIKQVAEKTLKVAHELAVEIHRTGLPDATVNATKEAYVKYKPVAKELVTKYEPVVEEYALWAWWWFNRLPIVSHMAQKTVSNATFWADRYNQVVELTAQRGYGWATHLPQIPVERISEVLAETANSNGDQRDFAVAY